MIEDFLVTSKYLKEKASDVGFKILDSRWYLEDINLGKKEYMKGHLPNAIFFDIEKFSKCSSLLPHTIISNRDFEKKVNKLGINNADEIIIYDQQGLFSSARTWFMFKLFGHQKVKILDGGYSNWKKAENDITEEIPFYSSSKYTAKTKEDLLINKTTLEKLIISEDFYIFDARPKKRFEGKEPEPRKNVRKGNIPGSISIPFTSLSETSGKLKSLKYLHNYFCNIIKSKNMRIVCMCGSGITACNIIFVLNILGYENVSLYDGSWTEWGLIEKKI